MNQLLKTYTDEILFKSVLLMSMLKLLIRQNLPQPVIDFFQTDPGKEFLSEIRKSLLEKATGFDSNPTSLNLNFSTPEEVIKLMVHKDEIIKFLKDEVGLEISHWYTNIPPMQHSTFVIIECI